jgi:hypothetical protein
VDSFSMSAPPASEFRAILGGASSTKKLGCSCHRRLVGCPPSYDSLPVLPQNAQSWSGSSRRTKPLAESSKISSDDSSTMVLLLIAVFRERRTATTMSTFRSSIPSFSHLEKMQELKALSFEVETISNSNSAHLPIQSRICVTIVKSGDLQENRTRLCASTKVRTFPPIQQTFDDDDNPDKSNLTS